MRRGVPAIRVGGQLVTTVLDLSARPLRRRARRACRASGRPDYDDPDSPARRPGRSRSPASTAKLVGAGGARVRPQRRGHRGPLDDRDGRRHQPLVPLRPDLPDLPRAGPCSAAARASTAAAGPTTSARRRCARWPAGRRSPSRSTGRGRRATSRGRRSSTWPPTSGATSATAPRTSPRRWAAACSRASTSPTSTRSAPGSAGCPPTRASTATSSSWSTRPSGPGVEPADYVVRELREGRLRFACEDPDAPDNHPKVMTVWRANLLGSSGKGHEYFLKHLLGTTDNAVRAEESPPELRPREVAWRERGAGGQARPADHDRLPDDQQRALLRRRAAGGHLVREVRPLDAPTCTRSSTPSTRRCRRRGRRRPTGTPSGGSPSASRELAETHLGVRRDLVAAPLLHDTPDEIAQPLGEVRDWRAGECEPVPGQTMPKLIVVERDYPRVAEKMARARARWSRSSGTAVKGAQLDRRRGGRRARRAATAPCAAASPTGAPRWSASSTPARRSSRSRAPPTAGSRWRASARWSARTGRRAGRPRRPARRRPDHLRATRRSSRAR